MPKFCDSLLRPKQLLIACEAQNELVDDAAAAAAATTAAAAEQWKQQMNANIDGVIVIICPGSLKKQSSWPVTGLRLGS